MDYLYLSRYKILSTDISEYKKSEDDYETLHLVIMENKVNNTVAKLPVKVPPKIIVEPQYGTINKMVQELYGNAVMPPTTLGKGQHRYIGIIIRPYLYVK